MLTILLFFADSPKSPSLPTVTPIQGPIFIKNGTVPVVPLFSYPTLNNGSFVQIPVSYNMRVKNSYLAYFHIIYCDRFEIINIVVFSCKMKYKIYVQKLHKPSTIVYNVW